MIKTFFLLLTLLPLLSFGCAEAAPSIVPDQSVMRMDDLGLYAPGYQLRGGPEVMLPVGWTSGLESPTGAACQSVGVQNGEEAWLLHCPWKGHTGVTFQDFTFQMPRASKIVLQGATALRADAIGKSDGATFRVFVHGSKLLDVNRDDSTWQAFSLDLTRDAGKTVTIRFETDPGPRDNPSFDFSIWGNRELVLTGYTPPTVHHPIPLPMNLARLVSRQNGSVVPLSGFGGASHVQTSATQATFTYTGQDGTLEYDWVPGNVDGPLFGQVTLRARMHGDAPQTAPLAAGAHVEWNGPATLTSSVLHGTTLTRTYQVNGQAATVTVTGRMIGKSLVFDIACDKPWVQMFDGGDWGPVLRRQAVNIPYYSLPIWYLARQDIFAGAFLDWTYSQASDLNATHADYQPNTNGARNLLRERLVYTAAWNLDETLPNIPNPPSPFRADLSKRVVLDIWGDTFAGEQAHLHALAAEGLGPAVALIHVWQHFGYDNGLPQHVPANAEQGGDPGMAALVAEGKRDGIHMALHENYTDYYPNYPGFTDTDVALNPDGSRALAWYNPGTKIQSFAEKPSRMLALAATQGPQVVQRYGSDACYLDVLSAVPPWFHVDFQAGVPQVGKYQITWDAHRALWAYERGLHHGPVFGEGNNHWYWSGYLDGVEAQFGQGWPSGQGTSAPLLADFDLLKMHPLQLSHGMGYYERWWNDSTGPSPQRPLMRLLDKYRMQEVAYGHEGFLAGEAWHDLGFAWLESHLMTPLTARAALTNPSAIDYNVNGSWLDTTAAAKAGEDWSRVRVRYANGLMVWANGSATPLAVDGVALPPDGWRAQGAGLVAGTWLRDGVVSDIAQTPASLFVNARPAADWQSPGQVRVKPSVAIFTPTGPRSFQATYHWVVGQTLPGDYHCFVHFVFANGQSGDNIAFQQDHALALPTSHWSAGSAYDDGPWTVTVPSTIPNGNYLWTIGLFEDNAGRLNLQGVSDAESRVILGLLHVTPTGVTFTPEPAPAASPAPINQDNRVLDFGTVRTNGSVFVQRIGPDWVLRPFPANRQFVVQLSAARFSAPKGVAVQGGWWTLKFTGAATYHWAAKRGL